MTSPIAPDLPAAGRMPAKPRAGVWRRLVKRRLAMLGLVIVAIVVAGAVLAPWLTGYDPNEQFFDGLTLEGAPLPPNAQFWLGTDLLGRDLLSRLIYGARTSLIIGVVANGVAVLIGALVGVVAGYFRGWVGGALMRFTDLMMAFPALLLAIVLAAIFQPQPVDRRAGHRAGELGADRARHLHRDRARSPSASTSRPNAPSAPARARILFRHILPHLVPTIIVWGTLGIATTVLLEATLSFLGIGVQPPTPSWGNIIFESQTYFLTAPWLVFFPGVCDPRCWRSPSTWSATRCATSSIRRRRGATDGRLSRAGACSQSVLILIGVTLVTFVLLYLLPADPVRQIAGRSATPQTVENIRHQLGLDRPLYRAVLALLSAIWPRAISAAPTCRRPRSAS